jgi:hypothetical protein
MNEFRKPKSLFFPLLLIAAGVFIFLINIGTIQGTTWDNLLQYWPVILIIGGLDGLYKRDGWVGPLVLIGLGTVLLLGNLHYLATGGFALLLRLWPILLVAIGLDIAFGHRSSAWNNIIRVFLGILLVAAIVWLAVASPFSAGLKSVEFGQPLDNAERSDITFTIPAGEFILGGGAEKSMLVTGTAGLPKEMEFNPLYVAPKNGKSVLTIEGNGVVILPLNSSSLPWDFRLNSQIPINLLTKLGAGEMRFDLTGTKVASIKSELGVGMMTITLPAGMDVDANLRAAVGELVVRIPKGSEVVITTHTAIGSTNIPAGYTKSNGVIRSLANSSDAHKITINMELAIGTLIVQEID